MGTATLRLLPILLRDSLDLIEGVEDGYYVVEEEEEEEGEGVVVVQTTTTMAAAAAAPAEALPADNTRETIAVQRRKNREETSLVLAVLIERLGPWVARVLVCSRVAGVARGVVRCRRGVAPCCMV